MIQNALPAPLKFFGSEHELAALSGSSASTTTSTTAASTAPRDSFFDLFPSIVRNNRQEPYPGEGESADAFFGNNNNNKGEEYKPQQQQLQDETTSSSPSSGGSSRRSPANSPPMSITYHRASKSLNDGHLSSYRRPRIGMPHVEAEERMPIGRTVASYYDIPDHNPVNPLPSDYGVPRGLVSHHRLLFAEDGRPKPEPYGPPAQIQRIVPIHRVDDRERKKKRSSLDVDVYLRGPPDSQVASAEHVTVTGVHVSDPDVNSLPASYRLLRKGPGSRASLPNPNDAGGTKTVIKFTTVRNAYVVSPNSKEVLSSDEIDDRQADERCRSTSAVEALSPIEPLSPGGDRSNSTSHNHGYEGEDEGDQEDSSRRQVGTSSPPDLVRVKFPQTRVFGRSTATHRAGLHRRSADLDSRNMFSGPGGIRDGAESGYNSLKEPPNLRRMHSNASVKSSPASTHANHPHHPSGLPPMQHPLLAFDEVKLNGKTMSLTNVENPAAEVDRLQRQLYDAQVCNYRLNHQLGQLASKDWKREESVLKKAVKDKTVEVETLKKRLEKAERDRRQLESRQPPNIQSLQGEKRELQIALEREETEKHELFMQINQLIGELADLKGNGPNTQDVEELRGRLKVAEHERDDLKRTISMQEAAKKVALDDLLAVREQHERVKQLSELEKQRLKNEIAEQQKQVQIKEAALQSLRLAKVTTEPTVSQDEVDKLIGEKTELARQVEEKEEEIQRLKAAKADEIERINREQASKLKTLELAMERTQTELHAVNSSLETTLEKENHLKTELASTTASTSQVVAELNERIKSRETRIAELEAVVDASRTASEAQSGELEGKLSQVQKQISNLSISLQDSEKAKRDAEEKIQTLNGKLRDAEEKLATKEKDLGSKIVVLETIQKDLAGVKAEVEGERAQKTKSQEALKKLSSELDLHKATVADYKTRVAALEEENSKLMEKASVEEELMTLVKSLQETRALVSAKETEISSLRSKMSDQQDDTDRMATELEQTQDALKRIEDEYERLVQQQSQRDETETRIVALNAEFSSEKVKSAQKEAEIAELTKIQTRLQSKVDELKAEADTRLERLLKVETEKNHLATTNEEKAATIASLESRMTNWQNQSATESGKISLLNDQIKELEQKFAGVQTEKASLTARLSALESETSGLRSELSKSRAEIVEVTAEKEAAENVAEQEMAKAEELSGLVEKLEQEEKKVQEMSQSLMQLDVLTSQLNEHHRKLEIASGDNAALRNEIQAMKNILQNKEDELEAQKVAVQTQLTANERAVVVQLEESQLARANAEHTIEEMKLEHAEQMKKAREDMDGSLRRLTDLLTDVNKRLDAASTEKDALLAEKAEWAESRKQIADLQQQLVILKNEKQAILKEKESLVTSTPETESLKLKISELTEENARLAADLLKISTTSSSDARKKYEATLDHQQQEWTSEKAVLESKISEQTVELQRLSQTNYELENSLKEARYLVEQQNGLPPLPKPRRTNTSLTNLTFDAYSERSITPSADDVEIQKLRSELEKQKRLVKVLRKKLQPHGVADSFRSPTSKPTSGL